MFERFTPRSRRAVVLAQEEARILNHNRIGTEHLLLGLLANPECNAARALASFDITLDAAREQVREMTGEEAEPNTGHIPFTPRAKKVLELSLREALTLRSQSIGTEHLLLGLVTEGEGLGVRILAGFGASPSAVRARVVELAGNEPDPAPSLGEVFSEAGVRPTRLRVEGFGLIQQTLTAIERRLARIEEHLGITGDPGAPGDSGDSGDSGEADSGPEEEEPPAAAE